MELPLSKLAIFAIVSAMGIIGVAGINVILTLQEIDAAQPPTKGCSVSSKGVNASQARCFHGDR